MTGTRPRIVLLHATAVAMEPIASAMARLWPEAQPVNLLDDALSLDKATEGNDLSAALSERFLELGTYAAGPMRGAGILATCSAFGEALGRLQEYSTIPVVKPNEPMFRAALKTGKKIVVLATFAPAVSSMEKEFRELAAELRPGATLTSIVVEGAIEALKVGDANTHNKLVARAASAVSDADAIMLAHFSTSRALEEARSATQIPVFAAPEAAVQSIRELVEARN